MHLVKVIGGSGCVQPLGYINKKKLNKHQIHKSDYQISISALLELLINTI